ncbi:MAG: metallophosphoesterase [Candidatus Omnitrophica bacterium]|nr:metallophosphoesterase [Candidatus Omnitrophota bacterium]
MKIGVISDTHIPNAAEAIPKKILEDFKGVDMIVHAGDLVDLAVLEKLRSVCKNVKAVRGNMDSYEVRKNLPEKEVFTVGRHRIGLMHGFGAPANLTETLAEAFKDEKLDLIIFGHSHSPCNEEKNGILFFNPGSPTDKVFARYNSYGIIEINDKIEARIIRI